MPKESYQDELVYRAMNIVIYEYMSDLGTSDINNHNPEFCVNICEREAGGTRKTRERARRAGNRDVDEDGMSGEIFSLHKGEASRETAMISGFNK